MNEKMAKSLGAHQGLRASLWASLLIETYLFIVETRGDLANGILFWLAEQLNPYVILFFAVFFTTAFMLGRQAGYEILVLGRKYGPTGLKLAALASGVQLTYLLIASMLLKVLHGVSGATLGIVFGMAILMCAVWLLAAYLVKRTQIKPS
jgi:hypothetical protein